MTSYLQDLINKNTTYVKVPDGDVRSKSASFTFPSRSEWLTIDGEYAPGKKATIDLTTEIFQVNPSAAHINFINFRWLGTPLLDGCSDLNFAGSLFYFPVSKFDSLPSKMRNKYNNRCRCGPKVSKGKNIRVMSSELCNSGSVAGVGHGENIQYLGNYVHDIGPSRDPLWHADTLGCIGGAKNVSIMDSRYKSPRFVFADAEDTGASYAEGTPWTFKMENVWLHDFGYLPFEFLTRGVPKSTIAGSLKNIQMWNMNNRPYRGEDPYLSGISEIYIKVPGKNINHWPKMINVTEENVSVVSAAPSGPMPYGKWWTTNVKDMCTWMNAVGFSTV